MRLKSFYAKTMTEAMQMVRDELGEEAIIVATREEKSGANGGGVRVTAAVDPGLSDYPAGFGDPLDNMPEHMPNHRANRSQNEPVNFETHDRRNASPARDWLQYDDENENAAIAEDITDALLRHGVSEDVMDHILSCATVVGLDTSGIALMAALEHLFSFNALPDSGHPKAMMMIGPPGVGKTLAVAKMAARGTMNGLRVGVVSCDTVRAGGMEQLQSFTNLLNIDLQKANGTADLKAVLNDFHGCDQVLIDTAGINPFDTDDIKMLARLIGVGGVEPYLTLPGGIDSEESGEMARVFSTIGAHAIIPTRVDVARRLGGLLSAAHQGSLSFADASNTPKVADGLISLSPKTMAKLLMPMAFREQHTRQSNQLHTQRRAGRA